MSEPSVPKMPKPKLDPERVAAFERNLAKSAAAIQRSLREAAPKMEAAFRNMAKAVSPQNPPNRPANPSRD